MIFCKMNQLHISIKFLTYHASFLDPYFQNYEFEIRKKSSGRSKPLLFAVITIAMCTFTKFMFVCIWKRMKQMDDNIVVRIATIQAIVMSLLFNTATWLQLQGQPFVFPVRFIYSCFACFFLKGSLLDSTKLQCLKDFIQLITICFRSVVEFSWSQMSLNKDFQYLNSFIFPASSL